MYMYMYIDALQEMTFCTRLHSQRAKLLIDYILSWVKWEIVLAWGLGQALGYLLIPLSCSYIGLSVGTTQADLDWKIHTNCSLHKFPDCMDILTDWVLSTCSFRYCGVCFCCSRYPEGRNHFFPLLTLALPGIDPNDFRKTLVYTCGTCHSAIVL